jgi:hypothetical protein
MLYMSYISWILSVILVENSLNILDIGFKIASSLVLIATRDNVIIMLWELLTFISQLVTVAKGEIDVLCGC